jgi:hypothetical protein
MAAMGDHGIAILDARGLIVVAPTATGEPMPSRDPATQAEQEIVWWLRYFAVLGQQEHFQRIVFAPEVRLALDRSERDTDPAALAEPAGWAVDGVDVLGVLGTQQQPDDMAVEAGDLPLRCADRPPPLMDGRRLTVTPLLRTPGSCGGWFAVEVYLDGEGRVAGVRLVR